MIGRLQGTIISKQPSHLLLDVNGVGYEIDISFQSFQQLADINETACLHTHLIVREDAHLLFGFIDLQERALFRLLIKINGIGPKLALVILSSMETHVLAACVQNQDITSIVKIPGIGKKTAERLVIELRDKLEPWQNDVSVVNQSAVSSTVVSSTSNSQNEAESALINLGYKPIEAVKAINNALKINANASSEDLIRLALRNML